MNFLSYTLSKHRDQLAQLMFDDEHRDQHEQPKLKTTQWLASSLLQKAIRRGEVVDALAAGAALLEADPAKLWRRLGTIVFEDVGIANSEALNLTVAAMSGKRLRDELGGDWPVASFIIRKLAAAPKCRAVDNLLMIAETHPRHAKARLQLSSGEAGDSFRLFRESKDIEQQAVAIWSLWAFLRDAGSKRTSRDPYLAFRYFAEIGIPERVLAICEEGYRKTQQALPLIYPLIWQAQPPSGEHLDDPMPKEATHAGLPLWAADQYTREGKQPSAFFSTPTATRQNGWQPMCHAPAKCRC